MQRSKINDLMLIDLVRNHSFLYDMSNTKYLDTKLKDEVWNEIGSKLKFEGPKCRSRWNNIRDQYKKRLKKTAIKKQHGSKKVKNYKYHRQLSFLDQYPNFNDMDGSPDMCPVEVDVSVEENDDRNSVLNDTQDSPSSRLEAAKEFLTPSFSFHDSAIPLEFQQHIEGEVNNQGFQSIYAAASLMGLMRNVETSKSVHPIDKFLEGIAPTLKSLSPYSQHLAKSEIFSVVQKYEMLMLKGDVNKDEFATTTGKIGRDSPA